MLGDILAGPWFRALNAASAHFICLHFIGMIIVRLILKRENSIAGLLLSRNSKSMSRRVIGTTEAKLVN